MYSTHWTRWLRGSRLDIWSSRFARNTDASDEPAHLIRQTCTAPDFKVDTTRRYTEKYFVCVSLVSCACPCCTFNTYRRQLASTGVRVYVSSGVRMTTSARLWALNIAIGCVLR